MVSARHPVVVLGLPASIAAKIQYAKAVAAAMDTNKVTFPSPDPPSPQFASDIAAVDAAQTAAQSKTKGSVQARDEKLAVMEGDLHKRHGYVQSVVDQNPEHAATIAKSAGMRVRNAPVRVKSDLTVKPKTVGSVRASALATAKPASHEWQFSYDGKTWFSAPSSVQASTTITNLTSGVIVYFRHRAVTKAGPGEWTPVVSSVVP